MQRFDEMEKLMDAASECRNRELLYKKMLEQLKTAGLMYEGKDGQAYAVQSFEQCQEYKQQYSMEERNSAYNEVQKAEHELNS